MMEIIEWRDKEREREDDGEIEKKVIMDNKHQGSMSVYGLVEQKVNIFLQSTLFQSCLMLSGNCNTKEKIVMQTWDVFRRLWFDYDSVILQIIFPLYMLVYFVWIGGQ